jgi:hypothetical protein
MKNLGFQGIFAMPLSHDPALAWEKEGQGRSALHSEALLPILAGENTTRR